MHTVARISLITSSVPPCRAIPDYDSPATFSLSANVEQTVQQARSRAVIDQLNALSVAADVSSRFDREKWSLQLSPILELWTKLAASRGMQDLLKGRKMNDQMGPDSPVDQFVMMEVQLASGETCFVRPYSCSLTAS